MFVQQSLKTKNQIRGFPGLCLANQIFDKAKAWAP